MLYEAYLYNKDLLRWVYIMLGNLGKYLLIVHDYLSFSYLSFNGDILFLYFSYIVMMDGIYVTNASNVNKYYVYFILS